MAVISPFAEHLPEEVQLPQLEPDYSYIQSQLMRADSLFKEGVNDVKNNYSAVINAPVQGQWAQDRKQQYINNFQQGLKRMSSSDLSMPQNVQQAENLLSPFWQDQDLLMNMHGTKYAQDNIQTIQQGLLSKDDKDRDMYNPIQIQDQQDYLQELADSGGDHNKLMNLQKRTISPFTNLTKLWNDRAKDQKMEIKYTEGTGSPYLVSTINGKQTIPNFKTWAEGQLGPETEGMFQTIGRVAANSVKRKALSINPNLSGDELNKVMANHTYDHINSNYANRIAGFSTDIANIDNQLQEIENRSPLVNGVKTPTPNDLPVWLQLRKTKNDYSSYLDDINKKYITFKSDKNRTIANIANDPQDYFAQLEKENRVNNWATGEAANTKTEIAKNDAYFSMMSEARLSREERWKEQKEAADLTVSQQQLGINADEAEIKGVKEGLIRDKTGHWVHDPNYVSGTGTGTAGNYPANPATMDINADNTAPLNILNPYEQFKSSVIEGGAKDANNALWSVGGAAGVLIDSPVNIDGKSDKISVNDVDLTNQAITKKFLNHEYQYNANEINALKKVGTLIGAKDFNDPSEMKIALESKLGQLQKNQDGTPNLQGIFLSNQIANANDMIEHSMAITKQMKDAVKNVIVSHPDLYKKVTVDGQIATAENMAKDFPHVVLGDGRGNPIRDINPLEFAKLHKSGGVSEYKGGNTLTVDGKTYNILSVNGVHSSPFMNKAPEELSQVLRGTSAYDRISGTSSQPAGGVYGRYGTPEEHNKLYKKAQDQVMNNVPEFNATTGLRGFQQGARRNEPSQLPMLKATTAALAIPSNTLLLTTPDGKEIKDNKDIEMIRLMLNEGEKYANAVQSRPYAAIGGTAGVQVDFSPEQAINSPHTPEYKKLIDKYPSIIVGIDPSTKNKTLQALITSPGSTQYGDMTTGKVYSANPIMKAHNFDYEITPTGTQDENGHYHTFAINGTYGYINPETGKIEKRPIRDNGGRIPQGTFSNTTPYQVIQEANNQFENIMKQNIANYNYYKQKHSNVPSFDQLEAQFQNQK